MKTWVKIGLGILTVGGLIGAGVAFLGKKRNEEDLTEVDETENYDSDSDEDAE